MKIVFGEKMKAIREENKWTLEEMAQILGTTKQALSKYERGERTPKITAAAKFANILGVPLKELVGEDGPDDFGIEDTKVTLHTQEARIISGGIDRMPPERREQALKILQVAFAEYADYFKEDNNDDA